MVKLVDFSTSDQFGLYQNKPLNGNADQGKCLAQDKTNSEEGLFNLFVDNQQSYLVEFRVNSGLQLELYVDGDLFYDFGVIEDGKKVHLLGQVFQLGGELFLFGYRD